MTPVAEQRFFGVTLETCQEMVVDTNQKYYLNLSQCNRCYNVGGNIKDLNIIPVNVLNINQGSITLISLLYAYFMCESFLGVVSKCAINVLMVFLLNVSPVFTIQINSGNQNSSLVNKINLGISLKLDLSSFIACDLKHDGVSPLYILTFCITYQEVFIKSGHYVCYNIHEDDATKFNDARIEYFSLLNEDA